MYLGNHFCRQICILQAIVRHKADIKEIHMNWLTQLLDHVRREHTRCKCSPEYVGKFLSGVIIKCDSTDENETPTVKCTFSIQTVTNEKH